MSFAMRFSLPGLTIYLHRNDDLRGRGNDHIRGSQGDDTIVDLAGDNRIEGGRGNDVITTGDGDDRIEGDRGDDVIDAGNGRNKIDGGSGDDIVVGGDGDDDIEGGSGRHLLIGGRGRHRVESENGDDMLIAGYTDYDNHLAALDALLAEWTSSESYSDRVANIIIATSGPSLHDNAALHTPLAPPVTSREFQLPRAETSSPIRQLAAGRRTTRRT